VLEQQSRLPVTDQGVVIPKLWFGDVAMVEVREENGRLVLSPVDADVDKKPAPYDPNDPIWKWGSDPITDDPITAGSTNLDHYLYGSGQ
jgi:hypothetical protein